MRRTFLLFLLIALINASCEEDASQNHFRYSGDKYPIEEAILFDRSHNVEVCGQNSNTHINYGVKFIGRDEEFGGIMVLEFELFSKRIDENSREFISGEFNSELVASDRYYLQRAGTSYFTSIRVISDGPGLFYSEGEGRFYTSDDNTILVEWNGIELSIHGVLVEGDDLNISEIHYSGNPEMVQNESTIFRVTESFWEYEGCGYNLDSLKEIQNAYINDPKVNCVQYDSLVGALHNCDEIEFDWHLQNLYYKLDCDCY